MSSVPRRGSLLVLTLAALLAATLSAGAQAQKAGSVESVLMCLKVERSAAGAETFAEAKNARPGDTLEYRLTYTNKTGGAVKDLLATVPIPQGTVYVAGSAKPAEAQASLDGSAYAALPLVRDEKQKDGTVKKVPVPLEEYRYLRWKVSALEISGTTTMVARVRVLGPEGR